MVLLARSSEGLEGIQQRVGQGEFLIEKGLECLEEDDVVEFAEDGESLQALHPLIGWCVRGVEQLVTSSACDGDILFVKDHASRPAVLQLLLCGGHKLSQVRYLRRCFALHQTNY